MFEPTQKEVVLKLMSEARKEVLGQLIKHAGIGPKDWHIIDEVMGATFTEVTDGYLKQLMILMEHLAELSPEVPEDIQQTLIRLNIHTIMLTTIVKAHFDVISETGRAANDAHLHLDRVLRAADAEQEVDFKVIRCRGEES